MLFNERTPKTHTLKLENIGDYASGIICFADESRQATDIDGQLKWWDGGRPRMTTILYQEIIGGNGINSATGEIAQDGDVLAIFVEGGTHVEFEKARAEYAPKEVDVGTFVRWEYVEDVRAHNPRHNARKVKAFTFSDRTPESIVVAERIKADLVRRLESYNQGKAAEQERTESLPPEPDRAQMSPGPTEEPF